MGPTTHLFLGDVVHECVEEASKVPVDGAPIAV